MISENVCMPIGYFITVDFRRKDTIYLERQLGQLGQPPNTFCGKNPDFLRNFSPFLRAKKVINM